MQENTTTVSTPLPWDCSSLQSPTAAELRTRIYDAGSATIATMCIPPILLGFMAILFIEEMHFFVRQPIHWRKKAYFAWILGSFPILSTFYVIGLFVPRTSEVISFASSFYFAICLKKFFDHILFYFGGKDRMEEALKGIDVVSANPFPCCFVVCCCRKAPMTVSRINKVQLVVYQVVFVFPFIYFVESLLIAEGYSRLTRAAFIYEILGYVGSVSSFMALYAFVVMNRASRIPMQQFGIRGKSICIQLLVACNSIQGFLLGILGRYNKLPCGFPYPDRKQAFLFHSYLIICELFLISIGAWFVFRRSEEGCEIVMTHTQALSPTLKKVTTLPEHPYGENCFDITSRQYTKENEAVTNQV